MLLVQCHVRSSNGSASSLSATSTCCSTTLASLSDLTAPVFRTRGWERTLVRPRTGCFLSGEPQMGVVHRVRERSGMTPED